VIGYALEDSVDNEHSSTNAESLEPLLSVETVSVDLEHFTSELSDEHLEDQDEDPDSNEHKVGVNTLENVELVMDLARTDHVENLE